MIGRIVLCVYYYIHTNMRSILDSPLQCDITAQELPL